MRSASLWHKFQIRKSARVILRNEAGNIALQHIKRDGFHKLPGGGVDPGESLAEALVREVREEVGCACEVDELIGMVIEYRNKYNLIQISYTFKAEDIDIEVEDTYLRIAGRREEIEEKKKSNEEENRIKIGLPLFFFYFSF